MTMAACAIGKNSDNTNKGNNMNKSDSINNVAAAFCKAQALIEKAAKDKTNPHFRSKYSDLGNVVDAIKPALEQHALSFLQVSHDAEGAAGIETIILHESGEWISCGVVTVTVNKNDAQGFGSAMTYARRYSLQAAFGVAPDDDDGNAAAKAKPEPKQQRKPTVNMDDAIIALREAPTYENLKSSFSAMWNEATPEQRTQIKSAYDSRKAELLAEQA